MKPTHAVSALCLLSVFACRDAPESREMVNSYVSSEGAGGAGPSSLVSAKRARRSDSASISLFPAQSMVANLKLIRTAELAMTVPNVDSAIASIDSIAGRSNAFISDARVTQPGDRGRSAQIVVRVAADRFSEIFGALRAFGKVTHESVSTDDVTKDYADLAIRMGVKQDAVTRLRSLLNNRTGKLSDVLDVERELSRAVTEYEQMKGELSYYDQRVAVSTISVQLAEPGTFAKPGFTSTVIDALSASTGVFTASLARLIYVVTFLVPWVAFVALVWLLTRRRLKWRIGWLPPA